MQYLDAHTHLNSEKLFDNYQHYIDTFVQIGGKAIVNVGADHSYNQNALIVARENTNPHCAIYSVLGLHPCEVESRQKQEAGNMEEIIAKHFGQLEQLTLENKNDIVAIGECGIDLHYTNTPEILAGQQQLFDLQLTLARTLSLPIVIHSRDAFRETFDVLQNYKDLKIYFHCWGYGPDEYTKLQDNFPHLWIGFTGNVSYPKAQNIRDTLHKVDKKSILLETDAPYLSPQHVRGKTNQPAHLEYIYRYVAQELMVSEEKLSEQILQNFTRFYT